MHLARSLALALGLILALTSVGSAEADCDGGAIQVLRVSATRLRLTGTVTRPGARHTTLLAGGAPFTFELADADDPGTILYAVTIPADRFVTKGTRTVYDRAGAFPGHVILRDSRKQADTVVVSIRVAAPIAGTGTGRSVRARLDAGAIRRRSSCVPTRRHRRGSVCTTGRRRCHAT